jgi:hypothetical protein
MSRFRSSCRFALASIAMIVAVSAHISAQTGVAIRAAVSQTVSLSVPQVLPPNSLSSEVVSSGNRVEVTFSNETSKGGTIRLPLLVRSNTGFKLTALLESGLKGVTQVAVSTVRPTGTMVSPQAVHETNINRGFDARGVAETGLTDMFALESARPLTLLTGPRISIGGTLNSPGNALEIVLLISLKSEAGPASGRLTLLATPESQIQ